MARHFSTRLFGWVFLVGACPLGVPVAGGVDQNGNQQSDIWEMANTFPAMPVGGDPDGDGFSNVDESLFGTDPRSNSSHPHLDTRWTGGAVRLLWDGVAGKRYTLWTTGGLEGGSWLAQPAVDAAADGALEIGMPAVGDRGFFRLVAQDIDSDGDGLTDAEEALIGFDPGQAHSGRQAQTDLPRATAGLTGTNQITVSVYDDTVSEQWPDPALFVLRRSGTGLQPLSVNVSLGGTATRGADYTPGIAGTVVAFAAGQREAFLEIVPVPDAEYLEPSETVVLTALPGAGYTLGAAVAASVDLLNETPASSPCAKAAARFLIQAAWGPDQDSATDADQIPENVESVMALGFSGWIDDQLAKPVGRHQPFTEWCAANEAGLQIYGDFKQFAWWNRVLDYPKLSPTDAADTPSDPLRQRIAFCLSQILVVSDRTEDLGVEQPGMANYYDLLLTHAFGNYRDLLLGVSLHPCMGMYLSHLGNKKPDPANRVYPDENFAREVMQLFSIGLWMLNPDGTRKLDSQGQPIPTYTNADITAMARVFTGLSFGQPGATNFGLHPRDFRYPMKGWDDFHDLAPKSLLRGQPTPARTASAGNAGTATMADVNAAIDTLFNHPNCGPFICHKLIQRLVTSNPSPGYVGRVAAAFADNGSGVRGDLAAVVKAILLDDEARNPEKLADPGFGKMREPLMRVVNFARAFNASTQVGWYSLDQFALDHLEEPQRSPSVFNYYLPTYSPPGEIPSAGLVAPEFQLVNASSAHLSANYFYNAIEGGLHRWGVADPTRATRLNLVQEMALILPAAVSGQDQPNVAPSDPDPLLRRLDLVLTGGTLSPQTFQVVREATARITTGWHWHHDRLRTAIYLIVNSPEFAVQR